MDLKLIDPNVITEYRPKGADPNDETEPVFKLRPLTGRQRYDVRSRLLYEESGAVVFTPSAMDAALRGALAGWDRFPAGWSDSNPTRNLDALPEDLYAELGVHVILTSLVGPDEGNA